MCHVFVTQSSLKRLFHVTRVMSREREFRSGLSRFHRRNEVKQGHKVQKINCSPDYILERIDIWCRFWKLRCFVIGTWPKCLYWRGELNAPEGQDKSSSFTADKMVWNVPPNIYEASMYHCGTWDCLNWMYFGWNICWRIDLCRAEPLICKVRKVKLHLNAP